MGNDIGWRGRQPDRAQQRACLDMLQTTAQKLGWEYEVFDGTIRGAFEDHSRRDVMEDRIAEEVEVEWEARNLGKRKDPILLAIETLRRADQSEDSGIDYRDELDLYGMILYPHGMDRPLYADHHVAFLFDNSSDLSEEDQGVLIDLHLDHSIDLEEEQWEDLIPHGTDPDGEGSIWSSLKKVEVRRGGHKRMISAAYAFMWLLLWIRERYIPSLKVGDDYQTFEAAEERAQEIGWLDLRSAQGEDLERLYLNLLLFLSKEIPWGPLRTSFDDMEQNWERMLDHVKHLKGKALYPIEDFRNAFQPPSDLDFCRFLIGYYRLGQWTMQDVRNAVEQRRRGRSRHIDLDRISIYALFLSSLEHRVLLKHGIYSIGQLLDQTDEALRQIPDIALLPEILRHIKEQLHFFLSRLDDIPDDLLEGYTLRGFEA